MPNLMSSMAPGKWRSTLNLPVADVDDMQTCKLSLEENGLIRKRDAEMLEHEFNREWDRNSQW